MTITSTEKDRVLTLMVKELEPEQFYVLDTADVKQIIQQLEMPIEKISAILAQFKRLGLVSEAAVSQSSIHILVQVEVYDLYSKGGFYAQEEVFKANIEKLLLEINILKKQLPLDKLDSANKIASIAAALFSGIALFKP